MEGPPHKKIKTDPATPLPPGWTEHTAPTGHKYFYQKATKTSTYTRPAIELVANPPDLPTQPAITNAIGHLGGEQSIYSNHYSQQGLQSYATAFDSTGRTSFQNGAAGSDAHSASQKQISEVWRPSRRKDPEDRPRRREMLPDFAPWILVYTRLGRRFVHNTETKESFWKFPAAVMKAVIAHDQRQLEAKYGKRDVVSQARMDGTTADTAAPVIEGQVEQTEQEKQALAEYEAKRAAELAQEKNEDAKLLAGIAGGEDERTWVPNAPAAPLYDSSEYEEVEVTDTEGEETDDEDQGQRPEGGPLEMDEDDIAFQLAAMDDAYDMQRDDEQDQRQAEDGLYGDADVDTDAEEDSDAGAQADAERARHEIFTSMLLDHEISPFTPWDSLVSDSAPHAILLDDRFTAITSARGRRAAFDSWTRARAAELKEQRSVHAEGNDNAQTAFLEFLDDRAREVRKLYWAEFRRKYRKEAALKGNSKFTDRAMEKLYRERAAASKAKKAG